MPFDIEQAGVGVLWTINKRKTAFRSDAGLDAWEDVSIDPDNDDALSGFYITLTGFQAQVGEDGVRSTTHPITNITELSITCSNRNDDMFVPPDTNRFFTSTSDPIRVGIESSSIYDWGKVFDESKVKYIPGLAISSAFVGGADVELGPISGFLPSEPLDPTADPPVYPMDTLTSFRPDTRTRVVLEFSATVRCKVLGQTVNETVTWTQTVSQNPYDWGSEVSDALNNRSYFANGFTSDKR